MGDIADMMMDGTLCSVCGVVFDDMEPSKAERKRARRENRLPVGQDPPGYPRQCAGCQPEEPK